MRVTIDTNVLISAIFWPGKPKQLLNQVRRRQVTFVTSDVLLTELKEVLTRRDKPFKLSEQESQRILAMVRELAEIVQFHSSVAICRDEPDNRVLECAIDGRAECLITGDKHLLDLQSFQGIKIATVADFLKTATP